MSRIMKGLVAVFAISVLIHFSDYGLVAAAILMANVVPVGLAELQGKLDSVLLQYKQLKEQGQAFEQKYGSMPTNMVEQMTAMQKQLDAIDKKITEKHLADTPETNVWQVLSENEGLKKYMRDKPSHSFVIELDAKQSRQLFEMKTTIDSAAVGRSTGGVLTIDRKPGIVAEARRKLFVRDLLSARPTSLADIDFIKVNQAMNRASVQTESSAKLENAVTFTVASARAQTIATWIPASKQVLDDMEELLGYLRSALPYAVDLAEEAQMLTGSGTGTDLLGMVTAATAFNTALHSFTPGWKKGDIIARAIEQVELASELQPTFVALNPADYWDIRLTKDTTGQFIDKEGLFWDLTPIRSNSMGSGNFLVGSGDPAAVEIRDRMGMTLEIAAQHSDYFTKNMVAIRAERRVALPIYRPGSFIQGTFNTSP